jgi:hypothetical protein
LINYLEKAFGTNEPFRKPFGVDESFVKTFGAE